MKKLYSLDERRAFWIGVGMAAGQDSDTQINLNNLKKKKIDKAFKAGYDRFHLRKSLKKVFVKKDI